MVMFQSAFDASMCLVCTAWYRTSTRLGQAAFHVLGTGSWRPAAASGHSHAQLHHHHATQQKAKYQIVSQSMQFEKQKTCLTASKAGARRGCFAAALTCAPCRILRWHCHAHGKLPNSPCHTLDGCCVHSAAAAAAAEAGRSPHVWMPT